MGYLSHKWKKSHRMPGTCLILCYWKTKYDQTTKYVIESSPLIWMFSSWLDMTVAGGGHSLGIFLIRLGLQPYRVCVMPYTHTTYRLCVIVSILPMSNLRFRDIVLESCGCCNRWPQPGWLQRAEAHSLTVLEALLLKSKYWQVCPHSSSARGASVFLPLPSSGGC